MYWPEARETSGEEKKIDEMIWYKGQLLSMEICALEQGNPRKGFQSFVTGKRIKRKCFRRQVCKSGFDQWS
jgi:hypothetical protein